MTFTGTADLTSNDTGFDIVQTINSYTNAKVTVNDKGYANTATLEANLLKSIIKTINSNVVFRGELTSMNKMHNMVEYKAVDKARKLVNQIAEYDPIKLQAYFRQAYYDTSIPERGINDEDIDFTQYVSINDLIHYQRTKKTEITVSPNNIYAGPTEYLRKYTDGSTDFKKNDDGIASTSITEGGDINKMYAASGPSPGYFYYADVANFESTYLRLECYFSLRNDVSISQITSLNATMSTRELSVYSAANNSANDPVLGIYNFFEANYNVSYVRDQNVGGSRYNETANPLSGLSETPLFQISLTADNIGAFASQPNNLIETVTVDSDTTLYRMYLMVGAGQDTFSLNRALIRLDNIEVVIELDSISEPEAGAGIISTVADGNLIITEDVYTRYPVTDTIGKGDLYLITDTLDDQITAIASQWGITINTNITNDSTYALTTDYTTLTKQQVFQDICDMTNSIWWYDPALDQYNIVSADNIASTGITITEADIDDYEQPGAWQYMVDASFIRNELVIQGSEGFGNASVTLTPEFSHALGAEQQVLKKPEIQSYFQLQRMIQAERHKYENARREATFQLDLDAPNQDYSALAIGKSIEFVLEGGTVANHTDAGSNALLITDLQFTRKPQNNNRRKVQVTARERFS